MGLNLEGERPAANAEGDGAPEFNVPEDRLLESYRHLRLLEGDVSLSDYAEAVSLLLTGLVVSGWAITQPAANVPTPDRAANLPRVRNISLVAAIEARRGHRT